jgi:GNAT superfamily N-acetyltransferase
VSDVATVAHLHIDSWRSAYRGILPDSYLDGPIAEDRRQVWKTRLSSPTSNRILVLLAIEDSVPIGFVCVLLDEEPARGACLDNLHVLPSHHGRGLGRELFPDAAQWVRRQEPTWPMHLWVFEENHQARRFYDLLEGRVVARELKRIGGVNVPSLCYSWTDLDEVVQRALKQRK